MYSPNVLVLENVSLLVLRIQGRPIEAISFPDTVGKQKERNYTTSNTHFPYQAPEC